MWIIEGGLYRRSKYDDRISVTNAANFLQRLSTMSRYKYDGRDHDFDDTRAVDIPSYCIDELVDVNEIVCRGGFEEHRQWTLVRKKGNNCEEITEGFIERGNPATSSSSAPHYIAFPNESTTCEG